MSFVRLPDFLVIGAARAGTTTLYNYLQRHPSLYLPQTKRPEPHFFLKSAEYSKGIHYYSQKYFRSVNQELLAGEISTSYLYQPCVPERIYKFLPNVKLIVMVRNPLYRAFSHYITNKNNGLEKMPFDQAIALETYRIKNPKNLFETEIQPFAYIDRGRYAKQIERYLKFFPIQKMFFIIFEKFIGNPTCYLDALCRYLGIPRHSFSISDTKHNSCGENPNNLSFGLRDNVFNSTLDDMKKLEHLLGCDLSFWKDEMISQK